MRTLIASLALGLFAAAAAGAEPTLAWPQFRGPGGSGVAEGQKPPIEFGPDKNVKWKTPVPSGSSSPIVVGNLLVLTAFDDGKLYTIAYTRADGKEAWRAQAPAKSIEPYHITEGSPGRFDAGHGRQANRLLLWIVRPVLLRPGRQRTLAIRAADRGHAVRFRHRRFAHPGRRSGRAGAGRKQELQNPGDRCGDGQTPLGERARVEIGLLHPGRLRHAPAARRSWRRGRAR